MDLLTAPDGLNDFFGLYRPAFGPVTYPGNLFASRLLGPVAKEILAGHSVVSIKGAPGAGKTSFMRVLMMELRARQLGVAIVAEPGATPSYVQACLQDAGGLTGDGDTASLLRALRQEAGLKRLVVLCDNAETLPSETFHYLSQLLKSSVTQPIALQLVLIGEMGVWPGLADGSLDALRAAASSSYTTLSLRPDEADAYLDYRFRQAGQTLDDVMTSWAAAELCEQARGNARRLDELTQRALLHGYINGHKRLTIRCVRQALLADNTAPARRARWRLAPVRIGASVCLLAAAGIVLWLGGHGSVSPASGTIGAERWAAPGASPSQNQPGVGAGASNRQASLPAPPSAGNVAASNASQDTAASRQPFKAVSPAAMHLKVGRGEVASKLAPPRSELTGVQGRPSGLVLIAGPHDTMPALYARVYHGLTPPPYATVLAANQRELGPGPVKPGALLIFPEPPRGWTAH